MQKKIAYVIILCSLGFIVIAVLMIRSLTVSWNCEMCDQCFVIKQMECVELGLPPVVLSKKITYIPTAFSQFMGVECDHSSANWLYVHGSVRRFLGKPSLSISGAVGVLPAETGPGSAVEFLKDEEKNDPELRQKIIRYAKDCNEPEQIKWFRELTEKYKEYRLNHSR